MLQGKSQMMFVKNFGFSLLTLLAACQLQMGILTGSFYALKLSEHQFSKNPIKFSYPSATQSSDESEWIEFESTDLLATLLKAIYPPIQEIKSRFLFLDVGFLFFESFAFLPRGPPLRI